MSPTDAGAGDDVVCPDRVTTDTPGHDTYLLTEVEPDDDGPESTTWTPILENDGTTTEANAVSLETWDNDPWGDGYWNEFGEVHDSGPTIESLAGPDGLVRGSLLSTITTWTLTPHNDVIGIMPPGSHLNLLAGADTVTADDGVPQVIDLGDDADVDTVIADEADTILNRKPEDQVTEVPPPPAYRADVTRREYRTVRLGMRKMRVHAIFEDRGRLVYRGERVMKRAYRGWSEDVTVRLTFKRTQGIYRLTSKTAG